LKAAIAKVLTGATWQRCRVHFMRNLLAHIPSGEKTRVAALVRTIFVQPHPQAAAQQVAETLRLMRDRRPQAASVLAAAEDDVLAYMSFPVEHWSRIYSTHPLERLHRKIRRADRCSRRVSQRGRDTAAGWYVAAGAIRRVGGGTPLFQPRVAAASLGPR
jgi:transposase-like protein